MEIGYEIAIFSFENVKLFAIQKLSLYYSFQIQKKNSRAKEKKVLRLGIPNVYIVTFFFRTLLVTLRIAWNKIFLSFSKDLDLFLQTFLQILKDFLKRFYRDPILDLIKIFFRYSINNIIPKNIIMFHVKVSFYLVDQLLDNKIYIFFHIISYNSYKYLHIYIYIYPSTSR